MQFKSVAFKLFPVFYLQEKEFILDEVDGVNDRLSRTGIADT